MKHFGGVIDLSFNLLTSNDDDGDDGGGCGDRRFALLWRRMSLT